MRVLIACEYSGTVRDAFLKKGHDAVSCDLLPTDKPGPHIQGDVLEILNDGWDLIIAHPPCTYLTNSGVHWLHKEPMRWLALFEGAGFFEKILNADCPRIVVENPIMHKYARKLIGGTKYSQIIQPWQFGHPETKATCLWIKGLPNLAETINVKEEMDHLPNKEKSRIHYMSPGKDRWKLRSITYQGIADAMAEQWG